MLPHQGRHPARFWSPFLLCWSLHARQRLPGTIGQSLHVQNQLLSRVHDNPVKFDHSLVLYSIENESRLRNEVI